MCLAEFKCLSPTDLKGCGLVCAWNYRTQPLQVCAILWRCSSVHGSSALVAKHAANSVSVHVRVKSPSPEQSHVLATADMWWRNTELNWTEPNESKFCFSATSARRRKLQRGVSISKTMMMTMKTPK